MKNGFLKGLLIYIMTAMVLILAGLFVFWQFIAAYELSRTDGVMDRYLETELPAELEQAVAALAEREPSAFETAEQRTQALRDRLDGGTLNYRGDPAGSTQDGPVYIIRLDKQELGRVRLAAESGGLFSFGLSRWSVCEEQIDLSAFAQTYTVTAPEEVRVAVNGVPLTAENSDVELGLPAELAPYADDLVRRPQWANYSFTAVSLPEVRLVSDSDEYRMSWDEANPGAFTVTQMGTSELSAKLHTYTEDFVRAYIAYTSNAVDGPGIVQQYLVPGGSMYERMTASMDGMSWVHGVTAVMSELQIVGYEYYGCAAVLEAEYVLTSEGTATDHHMRVILTETDAGWRVANIDFL